MLYVNFLFQEMACNTFRTIAIKCKEDFVKNTLNNENTTLNPETYIVELIKIIPE